MLEELQRLRDLYRAAAHPGDEFEPHGDDYVMVYERDGGAVVCGQCLNDEYRALLVALPVLVAWACSKTLARWLNRSLPVGKTQITAEDEALLRGTALRTWRFFRQFSNVAANWLVPDNVQQEPPVAQESEEEQS